MLHRHEYKDLVWVDLESPSLDEINSIAGEFGINSLVADELLASTLKPRTERYAHFLYLILHFPNLHHTHSGPEQEVDFLIGHDFVITVRYEPIEAFVEFRKIFEVNATLGENTFTENPFDIFLLLTKRLYRSVEVEIDEVNDSLEHIERGIFAGKEKEMVVALSRAGREILTLKQALDPHQDVLNSLQNHVSDFAGEDYVARVRAVQNMYFRARKHITRIWQNMTELRETNNSLLTTKQNEVMKIFTILAFVTFPLSLFASIFGMNTLYTPFVGDPYDFWYVIGIMGTATLIMFFFFRHKKWL